jgi:hypothetical protein
VPQALRYRLHLEITIINISNVLKSKTTTTFSANSDCIGDMADVSSLVAGCYSHLIVHHALYCPFCMFKYPPFPGVRGN